MRAIYVLFVSLIVTAPLFASAADEVNFVVAVPTAASSEYYSFKFDFATGKGQMFALGSQRTWDIYGVSPVAQDTFHIQNPRFPGLHLYFDPQYRTYTVGPFGSAQVPVNFFKFDTTALPTPRYVNGKVFTREEIEFSFLDHLAQLIEVRYRFSPAGGTMTASRSGLSWPIRALSRVKPWLESFDIFHNNPSYPNALLTFDPRRSVYQFVYNTPQHRFVRIDVLMRTFSCSSMLAPNVAPAGTPITGGTVVYSVSSSAPPAAPPAASATTSNEDADEGRRQFNERLWREIQSSAGVSARPPSVWD